MVTCSNAAGLHMRGARNLAPITRIPLVHPLRLLACLMHDALYVRVAMGRAFVGLPLSSWSHLVSHLLSSLSARAILHYISRLQSSTKGRA